MVLENEYYMVDIPKLIERKRREQSIEHFIQFQMLLATNNRIMDDDNYGIFVRNLTKNLEDKSEKQSKEFDRHAFEALRLMTNMGANKTGGR